PPFVSDAVMNALGPSMNVFPPPISSRSSAKNQKCSGPMNIAGATCTFSISVGSLEVEMDGDGAVRRGEADDMQNGAGDGDFLRSVVGERAALREERRRRAEPEHECHAARCELSSHDRSSIRLRRVGRTTVAG